MQLLSMLPRKKINTPATDCAHVVNYVQHKSLMRPALRHKKRAAAMAARQAQLRVGAVQNKRASKAFSLPCMPGILTCMPLPAATLTG